MKYDEIDITKSDDKSCWKEVTKEVMNERSDLRYHQPELYIEDRPEWKAKYHQPELYVNEDITLTSNGKQWNGPVNENMMETEPAYNLRGLLVFSVDVGQLPPEKAEAFVGRVRENIIDVVDKLGSDNIECVFLPQRATPTKVEYIKF